MLERAGFEVTGQAGDADGLIEQRDMTKPKLAVTSRANPDDAPRPSSVAPGSCLSQLESPEVKKEAKLPATAVTTKIAHTSSTTSMTFPTALTGLVSEDDTDSS